MHIAMQRTALALSYISRENIDECDYKKGL